MKTPREGPDGGPSDRNIKRRTEAPSTGGSSGADDGLFISPEKESSFERSYRHRKLINGSKVVFSGPDGDRIAGNIEATGLTPMVTMDLPVYPRLVRLFYCNLEYNLAEKSITSLVNGTPIRLDCPSLAAILGIPNDGTEYFRRYGYDSSCWTTAKYLPENNGVLPAKKQAMIGMLLSTFLPRRHHGTVTGMDKFLMNKILSRERVNLCPIIIRDMIDSIISHGEDLPYGMLLTKVFNAFDVVISREEEFETMAPDGNSDFFGGGGIQINAGWRSGSLSREVQENDKEDKAPAIETESLSKLSARVGSVAPSVEDLQCQPEQGFAILDEPLSKLTARVDSVDSKLSALVDSVASLVQDGRCQREQGLANLNESLGKLTARVDSLDGKFTVRMDTATSSVQDHWCQQVQGLTNLNESLWKLTNRVDALDGKLTARVDSVDSKLTALVDSVDSKLTARVDSVDSKLTARVDNVASSVQSLQCKLEKRFSDLSSKLDGLMGYLSYHFCPYPPPPTSFDG